MPDTQTNKRDSCVESLNISSDLELDDYFVAGLST